MQALENKNEDRRRARRLPAIKLCAYVQRRKAVLISLWSDVKVLDFNHTGLTMETDFEVQPDQAVTITLELKLEIGSITADRVSCKVSRVRKEFSKFICAVEFDDSENSRTKPQLVRIESLLSRSQLVADRIAGKDRR